MNIALLAPNLGDVQQGLTIANWISLILVVVTISYVLWLLYRIGKRVYRKTTREQVSRARRTALRESRQSSREGIIDLTRLNE